VPDRKLILSPLHAHARTQARKPSRITFAVATATVAAAAAVTAGITVTASPAAQTVPVAAGQAVSHDQAPLTSYATADRQLQILKARAVGEQVQRIAAQARLAAQRAAAQRAAARLAAAKAAAAKAAKAAAAQAASSASSASSGSSTSSGSSGSSAASVQPSGTPQQIALSMLGSFGWSSGEFSCLVSLWDRESGWNTYASNPSSGAYGIPQALPGSKMASAGADWATNPATQIRWGLGYIQQVYGSPCAAWGHSQSVGWY
jgi:hypothetical protein